MTKTLETLVNALGTDGADEVAYDHMRTKKVAEIKDYISPFLAPAANASAIAESCMATAEDGGRVFGNEISSEVGAAYTLDGNPLPFTL